MSMFMATTLDFKVKRERSLNCFRMFLTEKHVVLQAHFCHFHREIDSFHHLPLSQPFKADWTATF